MTLLYGSVHSTCCSAAGYLTYLSLTALAVRYVCCRVILHCVQFVLLLCLLVAEVIIQQHQLLQKSNFGSSNQHLPVTGHLSGGAYQRLPGSEADADKLKQKQQQEPKPQKEKFSAW